MSSPEILKDLLEMMQQELTGTYKTPALRAAYRAGMSTAASICDAQAKAVEAANPGQRKGSVSQVGQFGARVATQCGDKIMDARDTIFVQHSIKENAK